MIKSGRSSTANRAAGTRRAPAFSTVGEAHIGLIERLAVLKSCCILYITDPQDPQECARHLQQDLGAVSSAMVADASHLGHGGLIDPKYLRGLAGDVARSIANAANDLAAGRA